MNNYKKILTLILILNGLLLCSHLAHAQSKVGTTAVYTLTWQNSARVKAMGGCSVALVDAQSQFSNPAAMGIFALDNVLAANIANKTDAFPESSAGAMEFGTWGLTARLLPHSAHFWDKAFNYCVAFGYSYGKVEVTIPYTSYEDPFGQDDVTIDVHDQWRVYSGGLAFRTGKMVLGAGYVYKDIEVELSEGTHDGSCYDLGILASVRLADSQSNLLQPAFNAVISAGFVRTNVGSMEFGDNTYNFPTVNTFGLSTCLEYKNGRNIGLTFTPAFQLETFDEDIQPDIKRFGLEAGFNEAIFGRLGQITNEFYNDDFWSFGFGVSFKGLYNNILYPSKKAADTGDILSHLDIRFDFARSKLAFYEKTNFYHLSLSI